MIDVDTKFCKKEEKEEKINTQLKHIIYNQMIKLIGNHDIIYKLFVPVGEEVYEISDFILRETNDLFLENNEELVNIFNILISNVILTCQRTVVVFQRWMITSG
jgi:hypothetical protein